MKTRSAKDQSDYDLCDDEASSLVIDMRPKAEGPKFGLTAPWEGVFFDILGLNSDPFPYAKKKISWLTNSDFMFLALPNRSGDVRGIDQLFGDNTLGPDGKFADDGFHALAKYDGLGISRAPSNEDGIIDADDEVFSMLRLWSDRNLNGIAESSELMDLTSSGIIAIDLHYDPDYEETDEFGNKIMYKSVVKKSDGDYKLIFDLWFSLNK